MSQASSPDAPDADPFAAKRAAWIQSGPASHPELLSRYIVLSFCRLDATSDKTRRTIFAAIGVGSITPSQVLFARASYLTALELERLASLEAGHHNELKKKLRSSHSKSLDSQDLLATVHMDALAPCWTVASLTPPSSLTSETSPGASLARMIARRGRADWASSLRKEFGGPLFHDSLLLSMLRLIPQKDMQIELQKLLALSILCASPVSAKACLSLGANALAGFELDLCGAGARRIGKLANPPKSANLLGIALMSSGDSSLYLVPPGYLHKGDDAAILASCCVALGCVDQDALSRILSLREPHRRAPTGNALNLAFSHALVRCARHFVSLGMEPGTSLIHPEDQLSPDSYSGSLSISPLRLKALHDIRAQCEASAISHHLGAAASPSKKKAPRL